MFYTNQSSPLTLTVGDTYHDIAIDLGAAIVGAGSSPWAEVTGAGPTPAWLQPYATTAVAAADPATFNGPDYHFTMYLTTDPGLSEGTPYCVLVRFWIGPHGIYAGVIDTAVADPDNLDFWTCIGPQQDITGTSTTTYGGYEQPNYLFSMSAVNTFDTVTDDTRMSIYIWMWDECLVIQCKDADNASYDLHGGGGIFWCPVNIGMLGANRGGCPHIWCMNGTYDNAMFQPFADYYAISLFPGWGGEAFPAIDGQGVCAWPPDTAAAPGPLFNYSFNYSWFWCGELGELYGSAVADVNGDEIIQRIQFAYGGQSHYSAYPNHSVNACFYSNGWTEGIRIVRAGAVTPSYLGTVTIDGNTYTMIKNIDETLGNAHQPFDVVFLVPNVDLT